MDELLIHIYKLKPDVIALTETWLNSDIDNSEIGIVGYDIFRADRKPTMKGGGILIYVRSNIPAVEFTYMRSPLSIHESLWITISQKNRKRLFIGVIYRPPRHDNNHDNLLFEELISISKDHEILVVGDFNAPNVDWSILQATSSENSFDKKLLDFVLDEFLFQHVDFNTRYRDGQCPSCLDLILSKDEDIITDLHPLPPIGLSDHYVLFWNYSTFQTPRTLRKLTRNVWKADIPNMRLYLQTLDWNLLLSEQVEESWEKFNNIFTFLINNYCPLTTQRNLKTPKWMNADIKRLLKKKKRAWKLARLTGLDKHKESFRRIRNECKLLIKRRRISYETKILEDAINEPKRFYGYLNSKMTIRDHIPCLRNDIGEDITDDAEKAGLLSNFFQSVFTDENKSPFFQKLTPKTDERLELIAISPEVVKYELEKLKPCKSGGPDEIPSRLLKLLANELVYPLSTIFQQSLSSGNLPPVWKRAIISPIYKGGPKTSPNSFRPISLTCICCKILEKIIKRQMLKYLEANQLLHDSQHGFRNSRSCLTNLLLSTESWTTSIDEGSKVDVIYIDFKKAFDSVPHRRLLHKLEMFGISGILLKWLNSFLTNRTQCVSVNGSSSVWSDVLSGVPQGSVLGPLLFILYIDDLPLRITSDILLFADDVKIWKAISTPDDSKILQENLDALQNWSANWLLQFNTNKCAVLHLQSRINAENHVYTLNNQTLLQVSTERDLGVIVDSSLKPALQCANVAKKAMSSMRRIIRAFPILKPETFLKIYPAFIRPILEYGIQAWRPWLIKDKLLIENVQRRSTKLVFGLKDYEYHERLEILELFPMSYRQDRGDLIMAFKIIKQNDCCLKPEYFFQFSAMSQLRGHAWKIQKKRSRLLLRQSSFSQRVVNVWNRLPEFIISSANVPIFKARLDKFAIAHNYRI
jgi:hypothetical protein